jgi:ribulose-5-phosphate 4-epimerase/fuculose-1-phosphate aldolase
MSSAAPSVPDISEIRSLKNKVGAEEWAVREDLAATYRLVAMEGWDDMIFTHISARVPGTEHFLINPFGLLFEEITASSLIKIDVDGNKLEDTPFIVNAAGFTIHSALHMNREDAGCVIHLHTIDGVAVSSQQGGLRPVEQHAMMMTDELAYHDYEGAALDLDERERLVRDLGTKHAMILRNHGTLTLGKTCGDAFLRTFWLERACSTQMRALAGGAINWPNQGVPEKTAAQGTAVLNGALGALAWPALRRKCDRADPSYKN